MVKINYWRTVCTIQFKQQNESIIICSGNTYSRHMDTLIIPYHMICLESILRMRVISSGIKIYLIEV